jgi:hypothetical protein
MAITKVHANNVTQTQFQIHLKDNVSHAQQINLLLMAYVETKPVTADNS